MINLIKQHKEVLLFLCVLVTGILILEPGHNWGGDFALYIEQAIALTSGSLYDLYEQNKFAMEHSQYAIGPFLYPMGFPAILSPFVYFFGLDFLLLKQIVFLFFLGSLVLFFHFSKQFTTNKWLVLVSSALYFLHPFSLSYINNVLSDFPYLFFSLLALYFYYKQKSIKNSVGLGLAMFCSYAIRDIGLVLFLAFLLTEIIKNNPLRKFNFFSRINLLPYLIFLSGFILLKMMLPSGGSNHWIMLIDGFNISKILENIFYYSNLIQEFLFLPSGLFLIPVILIIILGVRATFHKSLPVLLYVVFVQLILILWPAKQGIRLLLPTLPFILFFAVIGLNTIIRHSKTVMGKALKISFTGVFCLLLYFFIAEINNVVKRHSSSVDTPTAHELYNFVQDSIPKGSIIAFEKPRVLRLFTKKNSVFVSPENFERSIAEIMVLHRYQYSKELACYEEIFSSDLFVVIKK